MPKIVFIAHPMSGDIPGNFKKVVDICRRIHSARIIPVFPSALTRQYLTPDPKDRKLAKVNILTYFNRGFIDELWLFGDHISEGMWREIETARKYGVKVVGKTARTRTRLRKNDRWSADRTRLPLSA